MSVKTESSATRSRMPTLRTLLITLIATAAAAFGSLQLKPIQRLVWPQATPPTRAAAPFQPRSIMPERPQTDRAAMQPTEAAALNAVRSSEALARARAVHDAWLAHRRPETGLYPRDRLQMVWSYRDVAADFFGHQLNVALLTHSPAVDDHLRTLAAERSATPPGQLCPDLDATTGQPVRTSPRERMFGTAEYAKDGLLSVVELHNHPAARARLIELADSVLAAANHQTRFGPIPDRRSEVNGDMLQVLGRLAFATGDARYAEMAGRIADAAVMQMLTANHGLPAQVYDYQIDAAVRGFVQIRDHGNELVVGLSEAYALAVHHAAAGDTRWRDRADRWAAPLADMYTTILERARDDAGLLVGSIDAETLLPRDANASDNWGYVVCGAELYCQAAQRHGAVPARTLESIRGHIASLVEAVLRTDGHPWEGTHQDGYADSLESAMYAAAYCPYLDRARIKAWVDSQIPILYGKQRSDGFVDEHFLDGNFMRTCLLYALMCSGGWTATPWSLDVGVGYVSTGDSTGVLVVAAGEGGWEGVLKPDSPRHRHTLGLPWNWPRINSWPEWRTSESIAEARTVPAQGVGDAIDPADLAQGIPLKLAPFQRYVLELKFHPPRPATPP